MCRCRREVVPLLLRVRGYEIHDDAPAELSNLVDDAAIKGVRLRIDEALSIFESNSANARVVHHRKLITGDVGPHRSDAPRLAIRVDQ